MKIETIAVHAGEWADRHAGGLADPIQLSTTFERGEDGGYPHGYIYARNGNPNRAALEECLAALEGGAGAASFASGMAAAAAIFQALSPGDHVVAPADAYYGTGLLLRELFERWGLLSTFIDMADPMAIVPAIRPETRLVWVETPTNPMMRIVDVAAIAAEANARGIAVVCDNTFATPVLQRPFELGVDLILHSTTKYLGGHSDVLGGAVVARREGGLFDRIREIQVRAGAVPSPFDCWLTMRGIRTLPVRVRSQSDGAGIVARYLDAHAAVERVHYPGLASHPGHAVAARQMTGFGGMLSIEVAGDAARAMEVAARTTLFTRATSLGGVHSLIEHRASVEGPGSATPGNLLRMSIGLEHPDDLVEDLARALG